MSEDPPLNPELLMSAKEWKELKEKMFVSVPTMKEFEELKKRVAKLEHEVKSLKLWKADKR